MSGATVSIVEQVLDEYGDPGRSDDSEDTVTLSEGDAATGSSAGAAPPVASVEPATSESTQESDDSDQTDYADPQADDPSMTTDNSAHSHGTSSDALIDSDALTAKQRETLREVAARPDATQAELADTLGVTSATISQRVNSIDGFDWSRRRAFVSDLFDTDPSLGDTDSGDGTVSDTENGDRNPEDDSTETAATTDSMGDAASEPLSDGASDIASETQTRSQPSESTTASAHASVSEPDQSPAVTGDDTESDTLNSDPAVQAKPTAEQTDESEDERVIGTGTKTDTETETATDTTVETAQIRALTDQLTTLSRQLDELEAKSAPGDRAAGPLSDPELTHKILHACLDAEYISRDEELRIIRAVTTGDDSPADPQ
ncbi:hypothetical protein C480_16545 [Natrialba aegyptia DSM 13077]|uniref:Uncharacterized protein n=1 Tax=Natrialba aegyptia DSM 13077 TaxID=1227491 RepID=M0AXX5_9EURY|nr:hypothetical protein C480_16545 [Natrialba aegyptia DSM 13077]